jgi:hypothetical protein
VPVPMPVVGNAEGGGLVVSLAELRQRHCVRRGSPLARASSTA